MLCLKTCNFRCSNWVWVSPHFSIERYAPYLQFIMETLLIRIYKNTSILESSEMFVSVTVREVQYAWSGVQAMAKVKSRDVKMNAVYCYVAF